MNADRKYLSMLPILLGIRLLKSTLIGVLVITGTQPVQAGAAIRKTITPTGTPTSIYTPTQTPLPFAATLTPGPTTTDNGIWKISSSPNAGFILFYLLILLLIVRSILLKKYFGN